MVILYSSIVYSVITYSNFVLYFFYTSVKITIRVYDFLILTRNPRGFETTRTDLKTAKTYKYYAVKIREIIPEDTLICLEVVEFHTEKRLRLYFM